MGRKRELARRCMQVRDLIAEKQYTAALEEIDGLPVNEVESIEDLYLFASIYEKAERLDMTKQMYYLIYNRTHSKPILYRLLRLVIRLDELDEARELLLAYEVVGGMTLDTYELRYRLSVAAGEPRSKLIEILENLKKEEYTEEWGYQLARLYEMEGEREKCIQECKDLKLWFGEGSIIDKAMELQERCESEDWEPPEDETIPEPEEPESDEEIAYAQAPVGVTELEDADEELSEDSMEEAAALSEEGVSEARPTKAPSGEMVSEARPTKASSGEMVSEARPTKTVSEEEMAVVSSEAVSEEELAVVAKAQEIMSDPSDGEVARTVAESYESVSEPRLSKKKVPPVSSEPRTIDILEGVVDEDPEDISSRGVRYYTLKRTIRQVKKNPKNAHFVFAGGEERITLAVAKRITKELNHQGHVSAQSIVKITADKLNQINLTEQLEKLRGGCMLITSAPEMNKKAVQDILQVIKAEGDRVVVMMAGPFDEMDCFLSIYPQLANNMQYKVRL